MNNLSKDINALLNIRLIRHIMFWFGYVLIMSYIHSASIMDGKYLPWFGNYLIELPVLTGLTYIITYFLIPNFLRVRKLVLFSVYFIICLLFFSALNVILEQFIIIPGFFPQREGDIVFSVSTVLMNSFGLIFPVVIFVSISFAKYINDKKEDETLHSQKLLQKQLAGIRNQMHPVFIRDVMNDLLIISVDYTNILPELILKISDILHYLVYDCNNPEISLIQEEQAVRKYLGFEQLVYPNYKISMDVSGNPENVKISPYILFSLIRAVSIFQKGDTQSRDRIYINIQITKKNLVFDARKLIKDDPRNFDFEWKDEIHLARKQLDSAYRWKYKLDVLETERKLHVILNVDL